MKWLSSIWQKQIDNFANALTKQIVKGKQTIPDHRYIIEVD